MYVLDGSCIIVTRPDWIQNQPYARMPPFYGTGASSLTDREIVSIDTESIRAPVVKMRTAGGREKQYWRRKVLPVVCATLAGRGAVPPELEALRDLPDVVKIVEGRLGWKALVARPAVKKICKHMLDRGVALVLANAAFDVANIANNDPVLFEAFLVAYAEGRIIDVQVREMLLKIAAGQLQDDDSVAIVNLARLAKDWLGIDRSAGKKGPDIWRLNYHKLYGVPLSEWPEEAIEYALDDASDTLLIAIQQAPLGDLSVRRSIEGLPITTPDGGFYNEVPQTRAALSLYLKGAWGMRTDPELHESWGEEIEAVVSYAEHVAKAAGILRANGKGNNKRTRELVAADLAARGIDEDHEDYPRTKASATFPDGQLSIAKETLLSCTETKIWIEWEGRVREVQPLVVWGEAGFLRKMRSTYYDPAGLGRYAAMLYDLWFLVATGRTSGRNPNMQNPPRSGVYRELFVAREGMLLCSTDFSSLELRTLAQIHYWFLGQSALRDAFLQGKDPHALFGGKIAGVDEDVFLSWKKEPKGSELAGLFKMFRQLAKALNFGAPGGLGAETMLTYARDTYGVDMYQSAVDSGFADPVEGKKEQHAIAVRFTRKLLNEWKAMWDEAKPYMNLVGAACNATGDFVYVQPISNRQRGGCTYCSGNNTGFQGLAADGAKEADWRLMVLCYLEPDAALRVFKAQETSWGCRIWPDDITDEMVRSWGEALQGVRPVLFIHDEELTEGPEATAHVWGPAQGEVLVHTMRMYTPDVPQEAEPALQRRWYKNADPVYDANKKLVPWEP